MDLIDPYCRVIEVTKAGIFRASCECIILRLLDCKILFALYWPPSSSAADTINLFVVVEEILLLGDNIKILGDFNLPNVNWCTNVDQSETKGTGATLLIELLTSWNMIQLVPTTNKEFEFSWSHFYNGFCNVQEVLDWTTCLIIWSLICCCRNFLAITFEYSH